MKLLAPILAAALLAPAAAHATVPGGDGDLVFTAATAEVDPLDEPRYSLMRVGSSGGGEEPQPIDACGGCSAQQPAWSPSGRRVAFTSARELFTVRPDGSKRLRLRRSVSDPSWSPGGRWLATVNSNATLLIVRSDGKRARLLDSTDYPASEPSWGVNGLIAYTTSVGDRQERIEVVKASGGRGRVLTRGSNPDWSPSGRRIAFARDGAIYVADRRGRHARLLVDAGRDPEWSPSGDRIAYVNRDGDVAVIGSNGRGRYVVAQPRDEPNADPTWQPLR